MYNVLPRSWPKLPGKNPFNFLIQFCGIIYLITWIKIGIMYLTPWITTCHSLFHFIESLAKTAFIAVSL